MPNELLWLIFILVDLSLLLIAFRLWGRIGLYAFIAGSIIVCNIQVLVTVELFGLVATLGNIIYASIFLATDILSELYGKKAARRGVWIGFFMLIWATIAMQIAVKFVPDQSDIIMPHLKALFELYPRIGLASLLAYLISQLHDIWAYDLIKRKTSGKFLWLRNNISTLISQLIDSLIFSLVAFWGVFGTGVLIEIIVTTYILKLIVAVTDTPFIYLARKIGSKSIKNRIDI